MSPEDRGLVQRALEARRAPTDAPPSGQNLDDAALAAYLDGTLSEAKRTRVEAALAASPEAVDLWLAARDGLSAPEETLSEDAIQRAQALVTAAPAGASPRAEAKATANRRPGIGAWLSGLSKAFAPTFGYLPGPLGTAFAAAALVLISAAGFELGRAGYGNVMSAAAQVESDDDFDLGEPSDQFL